MPTFRDRADAGRRLAVRLQGLAPERPVLLGLARGGVPVAAALARETGFDLDALVVRKIAPKDDREFGEGAVAPHGLVVERHHLPDEAVDEAKKEMRRRIDDYLHGRPDPPIEGRTAILVDDGLATGVTAVAAARFARTLSPKRLFLAVPVLSDEALETMRREVDEVVFIEKPTPFHRVEDAYASFPEVTDGEVRSALS